MPTVKPTYRLGKIKLNPYISDLGGDFWTSDDKNVEFCTEQALIDAGAVPLPEAGESECCTHCGWNGCPHCNFTGHEPQPQAEEIELLDLGDPIDPPFDIETIEVKLNQVIKAVNHLTKQVEQLSSTTGSPY